MTIKTFHGVGYNSLGEFKTKICGNRTPAYKAWSNMIERCYSPEFHKRQPAYIGCTVADEWHDYQVFAKWFSDHEYSGLGYQLDKDLLYRGNKVYSPDTCCFVPRELNTLVISCQKARGIYPQGVDFRSITNRFRAQIRINGSKLSLGEFHCPQDAHKAYIVAKEAYTKSKAIEWKDRIAQDVFEALMNWTV